MHYNVNNKCSMETYDKLMRILTDVHHGQKTLHDATKGILHLFSVSKRFNFPNFIAGVMVGILICTIIIELAY